MNETFVICGSEATGEDASIFVWKRDTGDLLYKIPGSGFNSSYKGHSNIINQVDGSPNNPYLFVSCSDDETVKLWGVEDKIKFNVIGESNSLGTQQDQIFKKVDVKNEGQSREVRPDDQIVSNS